MKQKACIVLPTYNEAKNIHKLLKEIEKVSDEIKGWELLIMVVDDNSPDGTANIVEDFQNKNKNVHLVKGKKQGLGVAYIRGFKHAIKKLSPDVLFEMDADFSHPPKLIKKFLETIDKGADFVIGSRYIPGGATPDWNLSRKIISGGGNFFARIVAGMYRVHDCTSGYRAIRTEIIKKIDLDNLEAKGYSFQMSLLYEAMDKGAKVKEIPLVFPDRKEGESKMKMNDLVEFFFNAFRLRMRRNEKLIKFCLVGGSGVIINLGILWLLTEFANIHYMVSSIIAIELSVIWNFTFNNIWTFRKTGKRSLADKILKFHLISLGGMIINWGFLVILTKYAGLYYLISNIIGIGLATAWNYLLNKNHTWKD